MKHALYRILNGIAFYEFLNGVSNYGLQSGQFWVDFQKLTL